MKLKKKNAFGHGLNMLKDILDRKQFQGPLVWTKCLLDQMSYGHFA